MYSILPQQTAADRSRQGCQESSLAQSQLPAAACTKEQVPAAACNTLQYALACSNIDETLWLADLQAGGLAGRKAGRQVGW